MSEKIIEVKHMTKIYNPETRHGKTTLLNNLSTIDTPTKGEVYIN